MNSLFPLRSMITLSRLLRIARRVGLPAALLLTTLFAFSAIVQADGEPGEVEIEGAVVAAPPASDGVGMWQIRSRAEGTEVTWHVLADAATEFDNGVPVLGDRVEVEARPDEADALYAIKIARRSGGDGAPGGQEEYEGLVLTRPAAADGVGEWQLQMQLNSILTVLTTPTTRFDLPQPAVGEWVEVRGEPDAAGVIVATRMEVDDVEGGQVVVRLAADVDVAAFAAAYDLTATQAMLASADIYLFTLDDEEGDARDTLQLLQRDSRVIWVELNFAGGAPVGDPYRTWGWGGTEPTDYENQAAFAQVNLPATAGVATGQGALVAVLDTGVDLEHPAFEGLLTAGRDLIDDDGLPAEMPEGLAWGHGTHTTGIIAHIAPDSRILPVRVLDINGRGNTFMLAYAIEWAVAQGADVINLSLGTPYDSTILRLAVEDAVRQGVVIVAAAGNDNAATPQYPGAYSGVITVTAVDENGRKADFANFGANWVDLAAPGVGIISTIVGPEGSGYATWSGTSMAAPFVSGAAALLAQAELRGNHAARLISTAATLDAINPDYAGRIGGLLDIGAALPAENGAATESVFLPLVVR